MERPFTAPEAIDGRARRRIGLTGGIATGKSTVAELLKRTFGLPVLDADAYARDALAPGSEGARTVLERYGERVKPAPAEKAAADSAALDRAALARIVFADPEERRWLEALVHPLVRARFAAELERLAEEPTVVLMIPLLFEAGLGGLCSEVWLVDCGEDQQLRRLMARDRLSEADARARIEAQWSMERKRPLADVILRNEGGRPLEEQLAEALGCGPMGPRSL
jgi:dephospho-CoA kinase